MTRELDDVFRNVFRDVFRGSDAIAAGVLTPGRLRGSEFERLFRDVYVRASTRVHLVLAGLAPVPHYVLEIGRGRHVRFDLAFPHRKVAVEYDGDWRDGALWALNRDRERLNRSPAGNSSTAPKCGDGRQRARSRTVSVPSLRLLT
jgi:hypothetical protein